MSSMNRYSALLLLDDEDASTGALALSLVRCGFDVVYANDLYELALVKRERGESALLLASPSKTLVSLAGDIEKTLNVPPERMVVAGTAPSPSDQKLLKEIGIRWCLCFCSDEEEIAYVLAAAHWELDPAELRFHARVPTKHKAMVAQGDVRSGTLIGDVSASGLRLLNCPQLDSGRSVQVWFHLAGEEVEQRATVAWAAEVSDGTHAAVGLCFDTPECFHSPGPLQRHVESWLAQHQLSAAGGRLRSGTAAAPIVEAEKRGHSRTPTAFEVLYTTEKQSGAGRLVDLSQSGCLLGDASPVPEIGARVRAYIFVQPVAPIELVGSVVRLAGDQSFALKFEELNSEVRTLLEEAATRVVASK
jgi:hypothetical protein